MSQQSVEKITCPECHQEGDIQVWSSINVNINPELREKVLSEDLWKWHCPHCGMEVYVPWGTLYHDMENRFMIFFNFSEEDVKDKYSPLEFSKELFGLDGYAIRTVFGMNNFKEKIHILEEHLNDVALERMRYMIRHILQPDIAACGSPLYLQKVERSANGQSDYGSLYFVYPMEENGERLLKSLQIPMDRYYEHELAVENDPRMALDGNPCVDEEWMESQLKKGI